MHKILILPFLLSTPSLADESLYTKNPNAIYKSCMLYKPIENPDKKKKYCECMNKELKNAVGVPLHVKERLSKEYTGNIDIALGLPFDDTKDYPTKKAVESPEGKALITVLGTCTNSTLNKK